MKDKIVKLENVSYTYNRQHADGSISHALKNIDISLDEGQFIVVLGRNGSGKSTFARLLNALLIPTKGYVYLNGMDTSEERNVWDIRCKAGMVFQNPDNQIVGTVVEEDVAFGPENLGMPPEKIREVVNQAMDTVGIAEYKKQEPHLLSGGQKQRVAIAGILAMKPKCIILDEATSMLDPVGRNEVIKILKKLNKEENITIIHITHHMNEAAKADRVIVMDKGEIVMDGKPQNIFSHVAMMKNLGLDVPQVTELIYELNKSGLKLPQNIIDIDCAFEVLQELLK